MPDVIVQRIAENVKTALEALSPAPTVERERMILQIGKRFPYIELTGPQVEITDRASGVNMCDVHFLVRYFSQINDEGTAVDTEITYQTRNLAGDIIKGLMLDPTRGDLAQYTYQDQYGYGFDIDEATDLVVFYVAVAFFVKTRISETDPYSLA